MKHSGAGRFSWIRMRPMSLWESCESSGEVSLGSLFSGEDPTGAVAKGDGGIPSASPFSIWYTIVTLVEVPTKSNRWDGGRTDAMKGVLK